MDEHAIIGAVTRQVLGLQEEVAALRAQVAGLVAERVVLRRQLADSALPCGCPAAAAQWLGDGSYYCASCAAHGVQ